MRISTIFLSLFLIGSMSVSCQIKGVIKDKVKTLPKTTSKSGSSALTNEEVVKGLKEALQIGTMKAADLGAQMDGFYKNPRLFIPWPAEAEEMKARLIKMGFTKKVEEFEMSLNRAAEEAAKGAAPIFTTAIVNMSVQDGFAILKGTDTAATNYLRKTTYDPLKEKFLPVVQEAIKKVDVTKYWSPLVKAYNILPGVKKQDPDLDNYVTNRAINGLMLLIADEEMKIRKDPLARVTDLLKKVFGAKK